MTGMGYRGTWDSTDQVPLRAVDDGLIRPLRLARHDRRRRHLPLQRIVRLAADARQRRHAADRVRHRLRPQSVLELHVLPRRSRARRSVPSGRPSLRQRRRSSVTGGCRQWAGRAMQNTVGLQLRNDDISQVGLYHTEARSAARDGSRRTRAADERRRATRRTRPSGRRGSARSPGLRVDGYRFGVDVERSGQRRRRRRGHRQPEGRRRRRAVRRHRALRQRRLRLSQQRRARRDDHPRSRRPASPPIAVTPLVRAKGAEVGVRTVAIPHLQSSAVGVVAAVSIPS